MFFGSVKLLLVGVLFMVILIVVVNVNIFFWDIFRLSVVNILLLIIGFFRFLCKISVEFVVVILVILILKSLFLVSKLLLFEVWFNVLVVFKIDINLVCDWLFLFCVIIEIICVLLLLFRFNEIM